MLPITPIDNTFNLLFGIANKDWQDSRVEKLAAAEARRKSRREKEERMVMNRDNRIPPSCQMNPLPNSIYIGSITAELFARPIRTNPLAMPCSSNNSDHRASVRAIISSTDPVIVNANPLPRWGVAHEALLRAERYVDRPWQFLRRI